MPISVSSGHFALRYEVPKFLARGGHLCMAMLTIAAIAVLELELARGARARGGAQHARGFQELVGRVVTAVFRIPYSWESPYSWDGRQFTY